MDAGDSVAVRCPADDCCAPKAYPHCDSNVTCWVRNDAGRNQRMGKSLFYALAVVTAIEARSKRRRFGRICLRRAAKREPRVSRAIAVCIAMRMFWPLQTDVLSHKRCAMWARVQGAYAFHCDLALR